MSGRTAVGNRRGGRKPEPLRLLPKEWSELGRRRFRQTCGVALVAVALAALLALLTYHRADPSWNNAVDGAVKNLLGVPGARIADYLWQGLGLAALLPLALLIVWGVRLSAGESPQLSPWRLLLLPVVLAFATVALAELGPTIRWPFESDAGAGGVLGFQLAAATDNVLRYFGAASTRWLT
ncbi:MAG: DNA translocase FtsK 4TM domain-containing protein, partial [Alphaproteobacteria bacterium]